MGRRNPTTGWWEPYSFHLPRYRAELQQVGALSVGFWLRPITIAGVFLALVVWWFRVAYPGAFLPIPQLVFGLFAMVPIIGFMFVAHLVIPRYVQVGHRCIQTSDGTVIRAEQIDRCELDTSDLTHPVLRVHYRTRRGSDRVLVSVLSNRVNIDCLERSMPSGVTLQLIGSESPGPDGGAGSE